MKKRAYLQKTRGFTLIELLVVVAIIAVLMALLMPSLSAAREQSKIAACSAKLRGFGTAVFMSQSEHNGRYPKTVFYGSGTTSAGDPLWDDGFDIPGYTLRWDEWMIVKGYVKNPDAFYCPSANYISKMTIYKTTINGQSYPTFATNIRHYGILRYDARSYWFSKGIGVDSNDATNSYQQTKGRGFKENNLKYSPGTCVAFGDADWNSVSNAPTLTANLAAVRNQNYAAIPGYRHNRGGNYVFLDGHVEWARHYRGVYANETDAGPASPVYRTWFDYIQP